MTMHLAHPAFTTTGKKKGPRKFRNAEAAQKARALDESWKQLQKKWGVEAEDKKRNRAMSAPIMTAPKVAPYRRDTGVEKIPSRDTGIGVAVRAPDKVYTGDNMLGIATMHKSNAVPVFSADDAIEISKMRR